MPKYYNKVPFIKKSDAEWNELNPILLDGEVILVTDDEGDVRLKVGDGINTYSELDFVNGESGVRMKVGDGLTTYANLRYTNFGNKNSGGISSEQYEELLRLIDANTIRIDENSNTIISNVASIGKNKTDIDHITTLIEEEVIPEITRVGNELTEKTSLIDEAITRVDDAVGRVDETATRIDEAISKAEEASAKVDEISDSIESVETRIEEVYNSSQEGVSLVNQMREEFTEFRTEIGDWDDEIANNTAEVNQLVEIVGAYDSKIEEMETTVASFDSRITQTNNDITSATNKLDILSDRVNNIINSSTPDGEGGGVSINLAEVIDIRNGYDGKVYETAGQAVRAIGYKLQELSNSAINADDLGLMRDEATGLVHPTYKGIPSSHGLFLSGGGGDGGPVFIVRNLVEAGLEFTSSLGDKCFIEYTFSSLDSITSLPTGNGTAYYYINSNLVATEGIKQGDCSFECSKYLKEGMNEITVTVKNADGDTKSLTWNVNVVSIRLTSTFDYTLAYNESITFKFTAYGEPEKKVHFILDGVKDPEIMSVTSTGRQSTKIFEGLKHGLHTLEVFATAEVNGIQLESNTLRYDIIVITGDSVEPIISINCNTTSLLQGELLSIPYIVYDPLATESIVNLDIHVKDENGEYILYKTEQRTVNRGLQYWNTRYYPLGDVRFTVRLRDLYRSFDINVEPFTLPIEPVTNDIELHLTSANRSNSETNPAVWEYNDIKTEFNNVNWSTSGWLPDANGDTTLHLTGGSTAVIKYQPFSTDIRVFGKTIEFEFAVRDVNNRDANVISCKQGGIGFEITADNAVLNSSLSSVECHFNDERRIRIAITIEARNEYRMMSVYLDGVLTSCKQYVTTDNFQQTNPVDITIGSPYCSVDLYTVRAYNTALTHNEIISNYICDIADITTKAELYDNNNLYDTSMNLEYAKVKKKIPVMTITGPLPASKGDKKKVNVDYEDPFDETMNFSFTDTTIDVQGTSSQWYVRKNYKLKFPSKYAHIKDGIATKTFCMKADYAEATSTHNTQNANIIHYLYSDKTPAQEDNPKCRTTIEGFPCVIYHKESVDSNPYFLGKYNFNYDKGSEEAFGFTDDYEVESWEFCNNTSEACNFTGNIPAAYEMKDENDNEVGWCNDFERRYPDHDYIDEREEDPEQAIARFKAMHNWVVSTKSYDLSNSLVLSRYRKEFEERFNLHKSLIYYVWTFFFLMVDQRAKNMFMTYWGKTGKWEPWFYDNDTCLGINNEGQMVFDYYHEDTDFMPDGTKVYNGQDSVLWNKFRVAYAAEIQKTYQELRSEGKLSYNAIRDQFVTKGSDMWSESIYNEDSDFKYISMLRSDGDATNLPQVKGTGEHHLEYFLDGRLNYCDSKWYASDYANDFVVLRVNTPLTYGNLEPNANITVTPFSNMYAGVRYRANGTLQQVRLEKNEKYTFIAPADNFNDTETAIYGASQLSSLGDLSALYCNYCDVSKAKKLIELKLGTDDPTYESRLETLSVGANKLLKKLDIRNCKSLHNPVDLSNCPSIEEVYAEGSSISSVNLTDGGYLRVMHLPSTVTNLTITNQHYIKDFTMESYNNIKELHIENTPGLPLTDILLNTPLLERVRLINAEWSTTEEGLRQTHEKLMKCGGIDETGANTAKAVVSGIVDVPSIDNQFLETLNTDFPELMVSVNGTVLCTVSYFNYDGTLLYVTTVEQGSTAPDIIAEGLIETPKRPTTDTHKYEYIGWSDSLENIQKSRSFVATYKPFYAVRFMVDNLSLYVEYVEAGSSVEDPIETGRIFTPTKESTVQYDYTFEKWDKPFNNITDVTIVNAVFVETTRMYTVSFYNGNVLMEEKMMEYGATVTYTGATPQKLNVMYPQDYEFLGWTPALGTVTGPMVYDANFSSSSHILDSWADISRNVANGTYKQKYPLGVLQRVILTYKDGTTEEVTMQLVGYDHDTATTGRKAGLTFIAKNVLNNKQIMSNQQTLNNAGWENSEMRNYLNETILPAIPSDLKSVIVPVVKKTSSGGGNTDVNSMVETTDTIWLPALIELIDTYESTKIYDAEGKTYDYFKSTSDFEATKAKRIKKNATGYAQRYWTRTPVPYSINEYWMISQLGGGISTYASYTQQGVAFGFCIGSK